MPRRKTNEEFVDELQEKSNGEFKALEPYVTSTTKIEFKHSCGHKFKMIPRDLLRRLRCPKCTKDQNIEKMRKTQEDFIRELEVAYPNKYKVLGRYEGFHKPIEVKCKDCGSIYKNKPSNLLNYGCQICYGNQLITQTEFENDICNKYGDRYEVIGEYVNADTPIEVLCNQCNNKWFPIPYNLKLGYGCPKCRTSKGELEVERVLKNVGVIYEPQYRIEECKNIKPLPFDFAVFDNGDLLLLIEYDGVQHFKTRPNNFFGGTEGYNRTKINDNIKNTYCINNNISLLRIPYWEFNNIEKIVCSKINMLIPSQAS